MILRGAHPLCLMWSCGWVTCLGTLSVLCFDPKKKFKSLKPMLSSETLASAEAWWGSETSTGSLSSSMGLELTATYCCGFGGSSERLHLTSQLQTGGLANFSCPSPHVADDRSLWWSNGYTPDPIFETVYSAQLPRSLQSKAELKVE